MTKQAQDEGCHFSRNELRSKKPRTVDEANDDIEVFDVSMLTSHERSLATTSDTDAEKGSKGKPTVDATEELQFQFHGLSIDDREASQLRESGDEGSVSEKNGKPGDKDGQLNKAFALDQLGTEFMDIQSNFGSGQEKKGVNHDPFAPTSLTHNDASTKTLTQPNIWLPLKTDPSVCYTTWDGWVLETVAANVDQYNPEEVSSGLAVHVGPVVEEVGQGALGENSYNLGSEDRRVNRSSGIPLAAACAFSEVGGQKEPDGLSENEYQRALMDRPASMSSPREDEQESHLPNQSRKRAYLNEKGISDEFLEEPFDCPQEPADEDSDLDLEIVAIVSGDQHLSRSDKSFRAPTRRCGFEFIELEEGPSSPEDPDLQPQAAKKQRVYSPEIVCLDDDDDEVVEVRKPEKAMGKPKAVRHSHAELFRVDQDDVEVEAIRCSRLFNMRDGEDNGPSTSSAAAKAGMPRRAPKRPTVVNQDIVQTHPTGPESGEILVPSARSAFAPPVKKMKFPEDPRALKEADVELVLPDHRPPAWKTGEVDNGHISRPNDSQEPVGHGSLEESAPGKASSEEDPCEEPVAASGYVTHWDPFLDNAVGDDRLGLNNCVVQADQEHASGDLLDLNNLVVQADQPEPPEDEEMLYEASDDLLGLYSLVVQADQPETPEDDEEMLYEPPDDLISLNNLVVHADQPEPSDDDEQRQYEEFCLLVYADTLENQTAAHASKEDGY